MTQAQIRAQYAVSDKLHRFYASKRYAALCADRGKLNAERFRAQDARKRGA